MAWSGLKLTMQMALALNSWFPCPWSLNARITGICHQPWLLFLLSSSLLLLSLSLLLFKRGCCYRVRLVLTSIILPQTAVCWNYERLPPHSPLMLPSWTWVSYISMKYGFSCSDHPSFQWPLITLFILYINTVTSKPRRQNWGRASWSHLLGNHTNMFSFAKLVISVL